MIKLLKFNEYKKRVQECTCVEELNIIREEIILDWGIFIEDHDILFSDIKTKRKQLKIREYMSSE